MPVPAAGIARDFYLRLLGQGVSRQEIESSVSIRVGVALDLSRESAQPFCVRSILKNDPRGAFFVVRALGITLELDAEESRQVLEWMRSKLEAVVSGSVSWTEDAMKDCEYAASITGLKDDASAQDAARRIAWTGAPDASVRLESLRRYYAFALTREELEPCVRDVLRRGNVEELLRLGACLPEGVSPADADAMYGALASQMHVSHDQIHEASRLFLSTGIPPSELRLRELSRRYLIDQNWSCLSLLKQRFETFVPNADDVQDAYVEYLLRAFNEKKIDVWSLNRILDDIQGVTRVTMGLSSVRAERVFRAVPSHHWNLLSVFGIRPPDALAQERCLEHIVAGEFKDCVDLRKGKFQIVPDNLTLQLGAERLANEGAWDRLRNLGKYLKRHHPEILVELDGAASHRACEAGLDRIERAGVFVRRQILEEELGVLSETLHVRPDDEQTFRLFRATSSDEGSWEKLFEWFGAPSPSVIQRMYLMELPS